ncbi:hypothetical protein ACG3SL_18195 [Sphingomonas sp. CJ20]
MPQPLYRAALLALPLLLAGCGGGASSDTVSDPTAQNVAAAAAEGTPAAVTAAIDCSNKPDFVPLYVDAQVTSCISAPDGLPRHVSGTIVYNTAADPRTVLGWSRAQLNASGLAHKTMTDTKYEAGEESERSVMVVAEPYQGQTRVTLNWGRRI